MCDSVEACDADDRPLTPPSAVRLLQLVWGYSHAGIRTVDVHVRRIRAKLGDVELVTTIRGVGYRLADDVDIRLIQPG